MSRHVGVTNRVLFCSASAQKLWTAQFHTCQPLYRHNCWTEFACDEKYDHMWNIRSTAFFAQSIQNEHIQGRSCPLLDMFHLRIHSPFISHLTNIFCHFLSPRLAYTIYPPISIRPRRGGGGGGGKGGGEGGRGGGGGRGGEGEWGGEEGGGGEEEEHCGSHLYHREVRLNFHGLHDGETDLTLCVWS